MHCIVQHRYSPMWYDLVIRQAVSQICLCLIEMLILYKSSVNYAFFENERGNRASLDSPPPAKKARCDPFAELRDGSSSTGEASETRSSGHQELASYKALAVPANHCSPLDFWRQNARDFPTLSEVARRVLCISASSAQSERDFASVGRTMTDAR